MMRAGSASSTISAALALTVVLAASPARAAGQADGFAFSSDPAIGAQQHAAYDLVHRYE